MYIHLLFSVFHLSYFMLALENKSVVSIVGSKDILALDSTSLTDNHVHLFVE